MKYCLLLISIASLEKNVYISYDATHPTPRSSIPATRVGACFLADFISSRNTDVGVNSPSDLEEKKDAEKKRDDLFNDDLEDSCFFPCFDLSTSGSASF